MKNIESNLYDKILRNSDEACFQDPDYPEFSAIRKFCLKEHTRGPPRDEFEERFDANRLPYTRPNLTNQEVKRIIVPRRGRDFGLYFGGEAERAGSLKRAAIHQGPLRNRKVFLEYGRLSFFFAVFDWSGKGLVNRE